MKAQNVNTLINGLEALVENHLNVAISQFQNLPPQVLEAPSATGGWSIAQCLEHLNSYGRYYLPQLQQTLSSANHNHPITQFRSGLLGNYFTNLMNPDKSRSKMKSPAGHTPAVELNTYEVVAEFIQQQEELIKILQLSRTRNLNKRVPISISKIIKLKLGDVLQFLIAHDERHLRQALRNL